MTWISGLVNIKLKHEKMQTSEQWNSGPSFSQKSSAEAYLNMN